MQAIEDFGCGSFGNIAPGSRFFQLVEGFEQGLLVVASKLAQPFFFLGQFFDIEELSLTRLCLPTWQLMGFFGEGRELTVQLVGSAQLISMAATCAFAFGQLN